MDLDAYVCLACERGRHDVCPGCACPECAMPMAVESKARLRRAATKARRKGTPAKQCLGAHRGGQFGTRAGAELGHRIAVDLLATCPCCDKPAWSKYDIAAAHGVTYEQVRTVLRNLQALAQ